MLEKMASKLHWYAVFLVLFIGLSLTLAAFLFKASSSGFTILISLGINLIASALVASLTTNAIQRELSESLAERILEKHDSLLLKEVAVLRGRLKKYGPVNEWEPAIGFDADFNRELMESLDGCNSYTYVGTNAKFVPGRLRCLQRPPGRVRVIMLDPRQRQALEKRARFGPNRPTRISAEGNRHEWESIRGDILRSIVALFESRFFSPITIWLSPQVSLVRLEVSDRDVFLGLHSARESSGARPASHPPTLHFAGAAEVSSVVRLLVEQSVETLQERIEFTPNSTQSDLLLVLEKYSGEPVSTELVETWRKQFNSWSVGFEDNLRALRR